VPALFDQVILLNGELIAAGPVETTFTDGNLHRTYHTPTFAGPGAHGHSHSHSHDHAHPHSH
jgi:ABC-type Mn2+/Zn2+ transport system ATPase subunit